VLLVHAGRSLSVRRPVLRRVLGNSDALRRVADQVHDPEDAVAEQQRAGEQHGQIFGAGRFHRRPPPALGTRDRGSPFGSPIGSDARPKRRHFGQLISNDSVVVVSMVVLVDDGMALAA
jgi:hypothetical protein